MRFQHHSMLQFRLRGAGVLIKLRRKAVPGVPGGRERIKAMQNSEVAKRRVEAVARGVGMQTQIYADRSLNSEIWDIEGNR